MPIQEQWEIKWKDYYEIVGVEQTATLEEIKAACYEKAQIFHPDNFVGKSERVRRRAEREFVRVVEAQEVLTSPERRARYDARYNEITRTQPSAAGSFVRALAPLHPILLGDGVASPPDAPDRSRVLFWSVSYLIWVTLAESLFVFFNAQAGMVAHIVLMVVLFIHSSQAERQDVRRTVLALSLVPLIRIVSLALPLTSYPQVYWYLITAVPLLAATVVVMWDSGLSLADVGFSLRPLPVQLLVAPVGLALGLVEYWILRPEPLVDFFTVGSVVGPAIILLIGTGFAEEFIFRGVLQKTFGRVLGTWGIIYVALIFAVLHMGYLSALDVVFVFAVGLLFAWVVLRTGSILGVTLAHGLTNISLFLVFPFLLT